VEYRQLGKIRLKVSEIGFGCGNVGGLMIRGSPSDQIRAVSRATALGINYFDTAPRYGDGQSETNLGQVLKKLQPKDVIVATKVGLEEGDLVDIGSAVQRSLKRSLSLLKRTSIDVLQLHAQIALVRGKFRRETLGVEDVLGARGVADAFEKARTQGLVHFCGFTGLGETEALHRIVESGRFDVVQAYYNLLNPSAGFPVPAQFVGNDFKLLIKKASERSMGVVVIRALAGGALGGDLSRQGYASPIPGSLVEGTDYETEVQRASTLHFLVKGENRSLPQAAIRFALMNRRVSTVLVGFSNLNQIEDAVSCSGGEPFPRSAIEKLEKLWATDFGRI